MPVATKQKTSAQPRRRRTGRDARRLYVTGGLLLVAMIGVTVRLFTLQVVRGEYYAEQARRQYESKVMLQAQRGAIYDRNGNLLATNIVATSFAVDPAHVEHPEKLAAAFADAFGGTSGDYLPKVTAENTSFVWIQRKVVGEAINRLKKIDDEGLIAISEPLRRFEYGRAGAQVIGCTNLDNNGLSGVELFYDESLCGEDGFVVMQRDARGIRRPDADLPHVEPQHGESLQLTIDINVQSIVEDELARGAELAQAMSGTAIALDPNTGEIRAMANWPSFDPNNLSDADPATVRTHAITDTYEPGSTMKAITAAAALEEGAIVPDDMIDGEGGEFRLEDGHVIRDDHSLGLVSFSDAFRWSSNVIFAKVADRIDHARFYKYVRDFGFGISTGIDLPGEVQGEVKKPEEFRDGTHMFMAYGYQLAVTPLQLAVAYAAIANGGRVLRPHIVKRRLDAAGETIEEIEPQEIRRVISERTAATLRSFLADVVDSGTGRAARLRGIRVAGKTGTAQQLFEGSYSREKYNASFVGFFPAEKPELVLLVLLNQPRNGYYGGQVAAPIFAAIARRIVNATMHEAPPGGRIVQVADEAASPDAEAGTATSDGEETSARHFGPAGPVVPDLRGLDVESARRIGMASRIRVMPQGEGSRVIGQEPAPGSRLSDAGVLTVYVGDGTDRTHGRELPDFHGMSLRRALALLSSYGLMPEVTGTGSGIVRGQHPAPGTAIAGLSGSVVLRCE